METLNTETIERLRKLGGDPFLVKMIDLFLDFGGQKVAEAAAASAAGDFTGVGRSAHAIKSSAANLGAAQVERIAASIEENVLLGRLEPVPEMVKELQAAFEAVKPLLQAQQQKSGSVGESGG